MDGEASTTPIKVDFEPPKVDFQSQKIVFLNDAQDHYRPDSAEEVSDEFIAEVQQAIRPQMYLYIIVPVNVSKVTAGGIMLSDTAVDHQKWTHGLGMVLTHGPAVYRGRTFRDQDLTPRDAPKVKDLVLYDPKTPKRLQFKNRDLVVVPDHALFCKVNPDDIANISYNFGF